MYEFDPAVHTEDAFNAQSLSFVSRFGLTPMEAVHEACDPPRPAAVLVGPAGRRTEIPAFEPQGAPLTCIAEALFLDAWDCWLYDQD